ncbi:unnamed protein product [Lupinus luteus]|uniref:Uncharacterized protein n=1 Tax=Lupinus luteus TaxID=3873 RepID=A0AAV1XI36_LUPLU
MRLTCLLRNKNLSRPWSHMDKNELKWEKDENFVVKLEFEEDPLIPIGVSYSNLYEWPKSDAEFVRSSDGRKGNNNNNNSHSREPKVVESINCRRMCLKSYEFSRKESVPEKTQKCYERVMEKVASKSHCGKENSRKRNNCLVLRRMKEISCSSLSKVFYGILSCIIVVDVLE